MPELPEVETTCRGIEPYLVGQKVVEITIRQPRLRWPIPISLQQLRGQKIQSVKRRGKYLLLKADHGTVILHLGMSGSLRIVDSDYSVKKHDHVDFVLNKGKTLRFHDPRRFGSVLWTQEDPYQHRLLQSLGIEPLSTDFNGEYLAQRAKNRKVVVKNFIMNAHIVVGIGNIYASESLFLAGIHPQRASGSLTLRNYKKLAESIQKILRAAITQGGTTLRDFVNESGQPGYFAQKLQVYGRKGEPCLVCDAAIQQIKLGQRTSYFCKNCQF